jgi:anti-sigma regulatory factor (Ser/Thr protein kinase)
VATREPFRLRITADASAQIQYATRCRMISTSAKVSRFSYLSQVEFIHPSGLGFIFMLTFTLLRRGCEVIIYEPDAPDQRSYLRRTNFWGVLEEQGFAIQPELRGYNLGGAQGLIEPSIVRTDASTRENVDTSVALFDRLRTALVRAGLPDRDRAASVFSELSLNAAEHSRSSRGAFVMAQAYPARHEIEIVVADVGRGIRRALGEDRYLSDADAIFAAMQELVTGRRDAAGNPAEGGYGLSIVAEEADYLAIRSGDALCESQELRDDRGELVLTPRQVASLDGTLVIATVSTHG